MKLWHWVIVILASLILSYMFSESFSRQIEQNRLQQVETGAIEHYDRLRDPKPGTNFQGLFGAQLFNPKDPRPVLVVYSAACSSCTKDTIEPERVQSSRLQRVIYVLDAKVDPRPSRFPKTFTVLSDPKGKIKEALNVAWQPRMYMLTPIGTLFFCQQPDDPLEKFAVRRSL
ncbi:MAG: hypothetical protein ACOYON_16370 [Fimbriimonas sp.]